MITLSITSAGIPWSTADLARITPDPEAPLCSVQQQLEALGYRVTAIQGLGMEVSAEVEPVVTAETITLDHMRTLRDEVRAEIERLIGLKHSILDAIGESPNSPRGKAGRVACAAAFNAALEHNLRGGKS